MSTYSNGTQESYDHLAKMMAESEAEMKAWTLILASTQASENREDRSER